MDMSLGIVWLGKYLGIFDYACLLFQKKKGFHFHNLEICILILTKIIFKKWAKAALRKKEIFKS